MKHMLALKMRKAASTFFKRKIYKVVLIGWRLYNEAGRAKRRFESYADAFRTKVFLEKWKKAFLTVLEAK